MIIYIVVKPDYDGIEIYEVFSSKDKAQKYIENMRRSENYLDKQVAEMLTIYDYNVQ